MPRYIIRKNGGSVNSTIAGNAVVEAMNNAGIGTGNIDISLACWVKVSDPVSLQCPFRIGGPTGGTAQSFLMNEGTLYGALEYYRSVSNSHAGLQDVVTERNVWHPNEWMHFILTKDSTLSPFAGSKVYINGVLVPNKTNTAGTLSLSDTTPAVCKFDSSPNNFPIQGDCMQVLLYDRILSSTEIEDLYYRNIIPTGSKLFWPLNDGSGSTANDLSSSNNDGALAGSAAFSATDFPERILKP